MSVWKKIQQQDVSITPYSSKKEWFISGSDLTTSGINFLLGSGSKATHYYPKASDIYNGEYYAPITDRSLRHLYYKSFNSSSGLLESTSSYDHYLESSFDTASRIPGPEQMLAISVPRDIFGTHIEPTSFVFGDEDNTYIIANYTVADYFEEGDFLIDDGEGTITTQANPNTRIGNMIYTHGLAIITDNAQVEKVKNNTNQDLRLKSNLPIYFYNYTIKLEESEFNTTYNPTAQSGSYIVNEVGQKPSSSYSGSRFVVSSGIKADNVSGSIFSPYITTVGLYNDDFELLAVAKLGKPVPKSQDMDVTIKVKLDL